MTAPFLFVRGPTMRRWDRLVDGYSSFGDPGHAQGREHDRQPRTERCRDWESRGPDIRCCPACGQACSAGVPHQRPRVSPVIMLLDTVGEVLMVCSRNQ